MPLALVEDVGLHPFQIARPEADDPVAGLPFQHLAAEFLIYLMRRTALELADELTWCDCWGDRDTEMHVRFDAADRVYENTGRVDSFATECVVGDGLDLGDEEC
jgi:hypothetical protein